MLPGIFQFCDTRKIPRCKLIGANGKDFGIGIKRTVIHFRNKEQQPVKGQFDKSTFNLDSRDHFKAGSVNCVLIIWKLTMPLATVHVPLTG